MGLNVNWDEDFTKVLDHLSPEAGGISDWAGHTLLSRTQPAIDDDDEDCHHDDDDNDNDYDDADDDDHDEDDDDYLSSSQTAIVWWYSLEYLSFVSSGYLA